MRAGRPLRGEGTRGCGRSAAPKPGVRPRAPQRRRLLCGSGSARGGAHRASRSAACEMRKVPPRRVLRALPGRRRGVGRVFELQRQAAALQLGALQGGGQPSAPCARPAARGAAAPGPALTSMAPYAASAAAFWWKLMKAQRFSGSSRMDWICPNLRGGAAQPAAPGHPPLQGRGNGAEGGRAPPRWRGGRSPGAQRTGTRRRDGQRPGGVGGSGAIRSYRDGEDGRCRALTGRSSSAALSW